MEEIGKAILGKKIYEASSTLESVQAEFKRRGHNLDLSSTCDQAFHDWYLHNRKRDVRSAGLPATTIEFNGVQYHIHGISHYEQTTELVRRYVQGELEKYLNSEHAVLVEQGLSSFIFRNYLDDDHEFEITFIDLPVVEMDDKNWAKEIDPEAVKRYHDEAKKYSSSEDYGVGENVCEVCNDIHVDTVDTEERVKSDPTYLADLQNLVFSTTLPEQLNRQYLELFYPNYVLMVSGRSRREAEFASLYRTQSKKVHMIVGVGHQPGIPYYLQELNNLGT